MKRKLKLFSFLILANMGRPLLHFWAEPNLDLSYGETCINTNKTVTSYKYGKTNINIQENNL